MAINITLEDDAKNATLFTRLGSNETWDACLVEINGVNYTAHPTEGITEGTPDVLKLPNNTVITIQSGQTILITIAATKIVDRFTDASFFDTNVTNAAASGFVSSVNDATGAIEEIQITIGQINNDISREQFLLNDTKENLSRVKDEKSILEVKEIIDFINCNLKRGICKYIND